MYTYYFIVASSVTTAKLSTMEDNFSQLQNFVTDFIYSYKEERRELQSKIEQLESLIRNQPMRKEIPHSLQISAAQSESIHHSISVTHLKTSADTNPRCSSKVSGGGNTNQLSLSIENLEYGVDEGAEATTSQFMQQSHREASGGRRSSCSLAGNERTVFSVIPPSDTMDCLIPNTPSEDSRA